MKTLSILANTACALSIAGTSLVFVEHFRDPSLWRRPARRLLVWLCVCDFLSALVYLLPGDASGNMCVAQALLGIYFPVASFVWTDCIALYVYLIVSSLQRRSSLLRSSGALFFWFHLVSWSIPLACVLAVYASGHAGKSNNTETTDWCWIKTADDVVDDKENSHRQELFLWEVVGGKAVEWATCALFLPAVYARCWCLLSR